MVNAYNLSFIHFTWMKTIQQNLKSYNLKLSLNEANDVAQNRPLWRLISTFAPVIVNYFLCMSSFAVTVVVNVRWWVLLLMWRLWWFWLDAAASSWQWTGSPHETEPSVTGEAVRLTGHWVQGSTEETQGWTGLLSCCCSCCCLLSCIFQREQTLMALYSLIVLMCP